jgi:acid stress-induced BolA-like protein IbaG/YrbA
MITAKEIVERIQKALPGAQVQVVDTGGGDHWSAVVVAPQFEGKSRVEQHKMVQAPLKDKIADNSIHALQLKTQTPAEATRKS